MASFLYTIDINQLQEFINMLTPMVDADNNPLYDTYLKYQKSNGSPEFFLVYGKATDPNLPDLQQQMADGWYTLMV